MTRRAEPVAEVPAVVVTLRGLPGVEGRKRPAVLGSGSPRLSERNALVVFGAAEKDAKGDRFGLGAVLYVAGPSVVAGAVLVPDRLARDDPERLAAIEACAADTLVSGRPGAPSFEVLTLRRFFDPYARAGDGLRFAPTAYSGGAFTIGVDLGRFFGLVAEHCAVMDDGDGWS
ncbi:MAG: hypothetical protein M0Z69_04805, partial [Actinomycetota bacterium]|nr:hypothetical protein [Actinomycetota bacterium]